MSVKEEIIDALDGMHFFIISYCVRADYKNIMHNAAYANFLCTYRPIGSVEIIYEAMQQARKILDNYDIEEITIHETNEILSNTVGLFKRELYCVELNNMYDSLEQMAEDIMIYRISGLMNKELDGLLIGDGYE